MAYIYSDEDNEAMSDPFTGYHNVTGYLSRKDMEYYESCQAERDREALENAKEYRQTQIREGFLDDLGVLRDSKCRECPWMKECVIEVFEDDADDDLTMPGDAYDLAQRMCKVCRTTPVEKREDALYDFFRKEGQ